MSSPTKTAVLGCLFVFGFSFFVPSAIAANCCNCIDQSNPKGIVCITTDKDCLSLTGTKNLICLSPLLAAQCKLITQGGVCASGPTDDITYVSAANLALKTTLPIQAPTLNVPIPGLTFATQIYEQGGYVDIPFLAQYISAAYLYLSAVSVIAAAVMLVYGGFMLIVASSGARVTAGKEIIKDAIIGLLLVLSSYVILQTVNPQTTTLSPLRVPTIDPLDIGTYNPTVRVADDPQVSKRYSPPPARARPPIPDVKPAPVVPAAQSAQPSTIPPVTPTTQPLPSNASKDIIDDIVNGAKAAGVDPCIVLANCDHESRITPLWNGQPFGAPKEKAIGCGACGVTMNNLRGGTVYAKKIKAKYPDFPDLPNDQSQKLSQTDKMAICDWLLKNHEGDAYASSLLLLESIHAAKGNEIFGLAGFKAGWVSMKKYADANGCTPKEGYKFKDALNNPDQAMRISCVPHIVAIPSVGDPPPGCPEDKYVCTDAKPDQSSQYRGHCSDGRMCKAMITDDAVKYILNAYPKMIKDYECDR